MFFKMYRDKRKQEQIFKERRKERDYNTQLLINDVIQFLNQSAPYFKYIRSGVRSSRFLINGLEIINNDNKKIVYDFLDHGYSVSYEAKRKLFISLADYFRGNWYEYADSNNLKDHDRIVWYLEIIAHDGLREKELENAKKASIRNC